MVPQDQKDGRERLELRAEEVEEARVSGVANITQQRQMRRRRRNGEDVVGKWTLQVQVGEHLHLNVGYGSLYRRATVVLPDMGGVDQRRTQSAQEKPTI